MNRQDRARGRLLLIKAVILGSSIALAGCATSVSGDVGSPPPSCDGELHEVPNTTNRPADPPLPSDYDPENNNTLQPEEASLSQLWAAADSEVGETRPDIESGVGIGLADFSAAITTRCYPLLTETEAAGLEQLKTDYESLTEAESLEPARAYFGRATELCM